MFRDMSLIDKNRHGRIEQTEHYPPASEMFTPLLHLQSKSMLKSSLDMKPPFFFQCPRTIFYYYYFMRGLKGLAITVRKGEERERMS